MPDEYSQAKLWDWDNLDPDSLLLGGPNDTATSNNPTAGIMSSNLNSNIPMSQAEEEDNKPTTNKNWGFTPTESATPVGSSAAAGGAGLGNNGTAQRPHTAHGRSAHIAADGTNNDDHVVAGARAMMRYRRAKETPPVAGAPSTSRSWGQTTGGGALSN